MNRLDYEREARQLEHDCYDKAAAVNAKFNKLKELVKGQIELKRLIKRNQKECEGVKKVAGRKRGPKPQKVVKQDKKRVCKIPFIVVKYYPEIGSPEYPMLLYKKKMKLTSMHPLKCYGDSTILSKMKLKEMTPDESLVDVLGPLGAEIP